MGLISEKKPDQDRKKNRQVYHVLKILFKTISAFI